MRKVGLYRRGERVEPEVLKNIPEESVGVFETVRAYDGVVFHLEEHLDRLRESAKTAGYRLPRTDCEIRAEIDHAIADQGALDAVIRLTFMEDELFIMVGSKVHPKTLYEQGVRLRTSPVRRALTQASFPEAKTSCYPNGVMAFMEPRAPEIYEWVFLNREGLVTEVSIGNLFLAPSQGPGKGACGVLKTPPVLGILNGVTRRFVIECASQLGLRVEEVPLTRHEVFNAAEVFLTNTSWEVLPVRELDGREIGNKIPGIRTQQIHREFKKRVLEYVQSHHPPRASQRFR
ncbi:MAG: aminotransferase class IV [Candidatus Omnitrophota bacterium]